METLYLSNQVNKVPKRDQLRNSTLIEHGLYKYTKKQTHVPSFRSLSLHEPEKRGGAIVVNDRLLKNV